MTEPAGRAGPLQLSAEVVSVKQVGAHRQLTLRAAGIGAGFRPGNFVSIAVGSEPGVHLARRSYWIHRVSVAGGRSTLDLLVDPVSPSAGWLTSLAPGTSLLVTGPLGRPFALPAEPVICLLVGEGYGAVPLFSLAERLHERGAPVHVLLGAPDEAHLVGALELRRVVRSVTVVTGDGSIGQHGSLLDVLPDHLARTAADVVYGSGPAAMLHGLAAASEAHGAWSQVALERPQPCGTGVCRGCAVPVVGEDGVSRTVRACHEGPVFRGDRVRWVDL